MRKYLIAGALIMAASSGAMAIDGQPKQWLLYYGSKSISGGINRPIWMPNGHQPFKSEEACNNAAEKVRNAIGTLPATMEFYWTCVSDR